MLSRIRRADQRRDRGPLVRSHGFGQGLPDFRCPILGTVYLSAMKGESILGESGEFAPRKIVGRPPTPQQVLWQMEQIKQFTDKLTRGKPKLTEAALQEILKLENRSRVFDGIPSQGRYRSICSTRGARLRIFLRPIYFPLLSKNFFRR